MRISRHSLIGTLVVVVLGCALLSERVEAGEVYFSGSESQTTGGLPKCPYLTGSCVYCDTQLGIDENGNPCNTTHIMDCYNGPMGSTNFYYTGGLWCGMGGGSPCVDTVWSPDPSTVCSGQSFTQTSNCGTTRTNTGTKSCTCTPTNPGCAANTCTGQTCWDGCANISGTKNCSASCGTAHAATLSCGDFVNCLGGKTICSSGTNTGYAGTEPSGQPTLALYNGSTWVGWDWTCSGSPRCAACLPGYTWNGSNCTAACTNTSWSPDPSTVCSGTAFTQTSNCGTTRTGHGTKSCTCTPTNPGCAANTCVGQTCWDGCNNVPGTKTSCSAPTLGPVSYSHSTLLPTR